MKRVSTIILICLLLIIGMAKYSYAGVDIGLTIDDNGIKEFHLAIGEHYKVPPREIEVCKKKNIRDNELSVVYFLAKKAGVKASVIIEMRIGGKSWMEITTRLGLNAGIFYIPLSKPAGPPYGKAYGHYRKHKKKDWVKIKFSDDDIINFVNLHFLSAHFNCSPDEIVRLRGEGKDFVKINKHVKHNKKVKKNSELKDQAKKNSKSKGKAKIKGKEAK